MEKTIMDNIKHLLCSHIVTTVVFLALITAAVLVTIGVVKFGMLKSARSKIALVLTVAVCSVLLLISQIISIIPVYKDYRERAYIVLDDVTMIIKDGSTGIIDSTNQVIIENDNAVIELRMQSDYSLDAETKYTGTIAYLTYSKYVIWYSFN